MMGKQPFERVVATHGATVLRVCRAVLGGTDADDAWSETFLSAMKASLPPRQKQAVAYHCLAGLPYTEVAAILGGSIDAARRAAADGLPTSDALTRALPHGKESPDENGRRPDS
jgi:DNA-directed RNA polymerase specialized sigma24 family protein